MRHDNLSYVKAAASSLRPDQENCASFFQMFPLMLENMWKIYRRRTRDSEQVRFHERSAEIVRKKERIHEGTDLKGFYAPRASSLCCSLLVSG